MLLRIDPHSAEPLFAQVAAAVRADVAAGRLRVGERLPAAREVAKAYPQVDVLPFDGLLRDFVVHNHGHAVVRGVRGVTDFEYEFQMAGMNRHLMADVETIFMMPSDQFQFVSSTYVREIATLGGDVSRFVAPSVLQRLKERVANPAG